ncbi:MAG TPA: hypothetical protein VGL81_16150 [Polyangiaceae bacterium]|jgi:hypothetical protein
MRRALASFALLALSACPAPADVTPVIHVDPRAAQRLAWFGKAPPADDPPAEPAPAPATAPARVHAMKDGEALGGPAATGRPGDLLLENAEVVFVVSGCRLVDAADAQARKDELGQMAPRPGAEASGGACEAPRSGTDADGSAWIETRARAGTLALTTRYLLNPPDRALLVETTVENTGDAAETLASLGDVVEWGGTERVAPGKPRGFAGATSGAYVGAVGRFVSYAVTSTEGDIDAVSRGSSTETTVRAKVPLAAHASTHYERVFLVGARPDTASLVGELALAAGQAVGEVKLTVPGGAGGATVELTPDGSTEAITLASPFEAVLPLGRYWITPRRGGAPIGPLDVKANGVAEAAVPASD